jgi:hypothetical protein
VGPVNCILPSKQGLAWRRRGGAEDGSGVFVLVGLEWRGIDRTFK